ncbi:hypothetical protein [Wolbachia endosymbiont of Pentidionis agamae]|uniref:hypothetical protein n=1 Tax=Wolbachia endosymbiont of Pentidionis agamae TaxID=3110435 RepID=UPI002FD17AFB
MNVKASNNPYKPDELQSNQVDGLIKNDERKALGTKNNFTLDKLQSSQILEIFNNVQNKVVNINDGLTLAEVLQALLKILNGNLDLLKKVLMHAKVMVENGMKIVQESQLSKREVYQVLLKNQVRSYDKLNKFPNHLTPNVKIKQKGRTI